MCIGDEDTANNGQYVHQTFAQGCRIEQEMAHMIYGNMINATQ